MPKVSSKSRISEVQPVEAPPVEVPQVETPPVETPKKPRKPRAAKPVEAPESVETLVAPTVEDDVDVPTFFNMDLSEPLVTALRDLGWETPTPIQSATIPLLLAGRDIVGQAQTGTGKTAAFALPILSRIDVTHQVPQVLVLTPTRELCIQVASVFGQLGSGLRGIRVLPVYGGQGFAEQLSALKKGVHIIVGTPGRVMDHMRRNTLKLDHMHFLVLDEADEMLNMGFAEDIEWILEQTSKERQTALFSATMPPEIRRIAGKYLRDPEEVTIRNATATAENTTHRYWITQNYNKFEVLTRILETEEHDGVLIFVKTKSATIEIAEALSECGLPASALNGDMKQCDRERTVNRFKDGRQDILVATDVAARGLDVDRISHVINYDPPHDTEGYVHRVGRTGRAGRSGQAIIIATPRERRFLADIERATRQRLEPYEMPSLDGVNRARIEKFKLRLADALKQDGCQPFARIIEEYQEETGVPAISLAAALARQMQGSVPLLIDRMPEPAMDPRPSTNRGPRPAYGSRPPRFGDRAFDRAADRPGDRAAFREGDRAGNREGERPFVREGSRAARGFGDRPAERQFESRQMSGGDRPLRRQAAPGEELPARRPPVDRAPDPGMDRYRLECGHTHGVMPGNIVGAIANEAGLRGKDIGHINIFDDYSTVDLPVGMPDRVFSILKKTKVANRYLDLSLMIQSKLEKIDARRHEDRPPRDRPSCTPDRRTPPARRR